ncbi:MAG TPA: GNAT family N-acetyltransferase [Anaerolineae bacterium]|nr:GNAT family N-acetyltransferase [Anaerolineae bacterium]
MQANSSFTIQLATWRDLRALQRLERDCFNQDAWPLLELLAVLTFPNTVRLKAVTDDRMVGFIAGNQRRSDSTGWIITLGVLHDHRRRGIASALLKECQRQLGLLRIRLTVRRSNQAAIALYRNCGYHQVEVWRKYYYGGEDALVLEKHLTSNREVKP